jgi:probable rRNA maturation factor
MQTVSFNSADKQLTLKNKTRLKAFIANVFDKEDKRLKKLDYVFCSDDYLLQINKDFLQHDYYTDIITFPLSDKHQPIVGEVYVSLDRIRDNAKQHGCSVLEETLRVLFHGALHLCGYGDKSAKEAKIMRSKEDFYISLFHVEQ